MKTMIDTNVLVYDAIENSPHHDRACEIIDETGDPWVNSLSIVELGFVLPRYGIDKDNVGLKLEEVLHSDYFTISWLSAGMIEETSAFIVENSLSFRDFNDWIITYDAHSRNMPLITFDKTLTKKCKMTGIEVIEV